MSQHGVVTRRQLAGFLNAISADPVGYMRRHGIKGIPGSAGWCPVSRACEGRFGEARFYTDASEIQLTPEHPQTRGRSLQDEIVVPTPRGLARFIGDFDDGEYPDLVADEYAP